MFPLGDEQYRHTVSQPVLFVNTETFQWKKNMRQIKEFLNIDTDGTLKMKYGRMFLFVGESINRD